MEGGGGRTGGGGGPGNGFKEPTPYDYEDEAA